MESLATEQWKELRGLLVPEQPCTLIAWHVLSTGIGLCWADRWPEPRCAVAFAGGNLTLAGDAAAITASQFASVIEQLLGDSERVFIAAPDAFVPIIHEALGGPARWPRVIFTAGDQSTPPRPALPGELRRIVAADGAAVEALDADVSWISDTLDGARTMAELGTAFGGFVDGRLVSVAVPFYVGERYEELGVVTEEAHRGVGWSTACAAEVIADIDSRGRTPCWSTTPDNIASCRIALKLGFRQTREEMHYVAGQSTEGVLPPE